MSAVLVDGQMETLINSHLGHSMRVIAVILHIYHENLVKHFETLGYMNLDDVWTTNNLTKKNT